MDLTQYTRRWHSDMEPEAAVTHNEIHESIATVKNELVCLIE